MKETDEGIFIHRTSFSESSAIVGYFTRKHGYQKFVFLGAKKKNVQLFPLNVQELHYFKRPDSDLGKLTEAKNSHAVVNIPFDPIRSALAFFIAEVIQKTLNHTEKDEDLYDFLLSQIEVLDKEDELSFFPQQFLLKFSEYLGINPHIETETPTTFQLKEGVFSEENTADLSVQGEEMFYLFELMQGRVVSSNLSTRRKALDAMIRYYQLHMNHFGDLKTKAVIDEIFRA